MKQNKMGRFICSLWILVPVFSLLRLSQPMLWVIKNEGFTCRMPPSKTYYGWQLLFRSNLTNAYGDVVTDMSNPVFVLLKIMIALPLIYDVISVSICIREWRDKRSSKDLLKFKGILSMGYVLTAFATYRWIVVYGDQLWERMLDEAQQSSYAGACIEILEINILFYCAVVVLLIVSCLFCRKISAYRFICYVWFLVPVLSLFILMQQMIIVGDDVGIETERVYNGLQMLFCGKLRNLYKEPVIDCQNVGFVCIKIMLVLSLLFDAILVFLVFWEWRKKQNPKQFLYFRGILSVGYVLTALSICLLIKSWIDNPARNLLLETGYISSTWHWGIECIFYHSIGVVVLFILTGFVFLFSKKRKSKTVSMAVLESFRR